MPKKKNKSDFMDGSHLVHCGKYDHSKVDYKNNYTNACIICHEHGEFWQTPNSRLNGSGCPECGKAKRNENGTKSLSKFIEEARKAHGDKYDYSKVEYANANTKVRITCPVHGEFWQTPHSHLNGSGCPECAREMKSDLMRSDVGEFIAKARKAHCDKYDYSKAEYVNAKTRVCIICPEHGEFWQTPNMHLCGHGCPECGKAKRNENETKSLAKFIEDARKVHGGKYDYSKVEYVNAKTKICITCPRHGEFWQVPYNHLSGKGCPGCSRERRNGLMTGNADKFIAKAMNVHGGKYDYSKVEYKNNHTKVCIICPWHGEFWQLPYDHLCGKGCPGCGKERTVFGRTSNTAKFIEEARKAHCDKYDYSKAEYVNAKTRVCIICPEHGEFWQLPHNHLKGKGCPECGKAKRNENETKSLSKFIEEARNAHGDKYDYSKAEYVNAKTKICIICPKHGEFWQVPYSHLSGCGCPKCSNRMSKAEDEILEMLKALNPQQRNRGILGGREIDIYIPSLRLGIEYNGLRWHSEDFVKGKHYHLDKLNRCNEQGVRLIQVFEDEWVNHREICESKLRQICGLNGNPKVYARKCAVREICNHEAEGFLNANHIQGFVASTVYLGAFLDWKLVGVMTFKREKPGFWELSRFATDINYQCIGIGGKLLRHFTRNHVFKEVKSFADRRWTTDPTDNLYTKLGFELDGFTRPDYRYFKNGETETHHKFGFRKQILHEKYGLPLTMTESEMTKELGYERIWDCGLIKYTYQLPLA